MEAGQTAPTSNRIAPHTMCDEARNGVSSPVRDALRGPRRHSRRCSLSQRPSTRPTAWLLISLKRGTGWPTCQTLSSQSVVIVLLSIGRELSIPDSRQQWIVSSCPLTFGCFLLLGGRIADIYGKRLLFILGSVWVIFMAAANPFMPHEVAFDLFRGLHGLV